MNIIDIKNANLSQWNQPGRDCNTHRYIALHYLGVDNADNPYLYSSGSDTGFGGHYYINIAGDKVYQAAPENAVLWAVGTGGYYQKLHPYADNYSTVSIEIGTYKDASGVWRFTEKAQQTAVELVQYLMKKLNIPIGNVLRHGDITSKRCPLPWTDHQGMNGNWTWEQFKAKVASSTATATTTGGNGYMFNCSTVQYGSKGATVKLLQRLLIGFGYSVGNVDGDFGAKTKSAVLSFQKANGLTQDAIVGNMTWAKLLGV